MEQNVIFKGHHYLALKTPHISYFHPNSPIESLYNSITVTPGPLKSKHFLTQQISGRSAARFVSSPLLFLYFCVKPSE